MICLLGGEGCEVIADVENLREYPREIQNVAAEIVSLFGSDTYDPESFLVDQDFSLSQVAELMNKVNLEFNEYRMRPVPKKDSKSSTEYCVICNEYPKETVHIVGKGDILKIQHSVNRLD